MKRKKIIAAVLSAVIALLWLGGLILFANNVPNQLPEAPLKPLDAIVVLTGGSNRLDTGFNLLEKKLGKKLFISGVYRGIDARQLLKRWKQEPQSNLDCCVELGFEAYNTADNAVETIEWMKQEKLKSFYLVTSNYHIKRAMLEFEKNSSGLEISPFPIIPSNVDMNVWWKHTQSRNLILSEYTKYIAVYLLHNFVKR